METKELHGLQLQLLGIACMLEAIRLEMRAQAIASLRTGSERTQDLAAADSCAQEGLANAETPIRYNAETPIRYRETHR